ncbi:MAG: LysR family transcriptional regulator [Pseudomonadota bacterium]|jgi:DNA-binding transcriptional LysR family regulator|uniref:HTH lysR-type domain-containing protein n=1 Tax=marine metagenome TaxID=408172 RepID=A0A381U0G6_9ZZZZ|nr:LysR family transcriptional regulator [Pirellulaceae bacterium]MEC8870522.1 LysR family transcriptional regulator [Pseudomonadota bacterium]|tara:strand:+ start:3315 stop:4199 length:885 start_codon:yes stop_codon:yes gene_type:complete
MNLRQLEAFRATLRIGSVTGAAKQLTLSQPSVTRLVKELERSVGFPLFVRSGRGIVATVEGRRFGDAVEGMFAGTDKLKETADAIRDSIHGEVQIGVTPVLLYQITPEAIAKLHHRKPNLKIGLKVNNSPGLIDAVIMQQLDLAVVNVYRRPDTLHVLYEKKLHYVCLLPEKHALAQSVTPIDLEMIKDVQHVAYDRARLQIAQPNWLQLMSWPQADLSAYSNIAVASLARATGKLAIVDPYTAKTVAALGGVVTRPIRQRLISTLCVVGRSVDTLSLAVRELADAVIAELDTT